MNDVIRERGLPTCADYLAQRAAADAVPSAGHPARNAAG
jgi:hypothetical protein